jgi:hypothetical protein
VATKATDRGLHGAIFLQFAIIHGSLALFGCVLLISSITVSPRSRSWCCTRRHDRMKDDRIVRFVTFHITRRIAVVSRTRYCRDRRAQSATAYGYKFIAA